MKEPANGRTLWHALIVKPRHEKTSASALSYKGFEEFLPLYKERRRWSDRLQEVQLPVFPGYVFCRFAPEQRVSVLSTPGVASVVGIGNRPAPISDDEIAAMKSVIRSGLPAQPWPYLEAGALVRIIDGPLEGLEGILLQNKQHHRLVLSVTLLRRSVAVEVDRGWVAPQAARAGSM